MDFSSVSGLTVMMGQDSETGSKAYVFRSADDELLFVVPSEGVLIGVEELGSGELASFVPKTLTVKQFDRLLGVVDG